MPADFDRLADSDRLRVYAFSPAGAIDDRADALSRACDHLALHGVEIVPDRGLLARHQRFAGRDAQRAQAFVRAAMSDCPAVIASRGGYGMTRLLDLLDFPALARTGKQWVGLSDFTAFHLAMLAQGGATTWAGPCLVSSFGKSPPESVDETTRDTLLDALHGRLEVVGFACQAPRGVPEIENATLWGGNLALVSNLIGTPWFPDVSGGVLFLEDVNEHPYRIERMLTQLLHAGVMDRQQAVLLGHFTGGATVPEQDQGFDLKAVVKWLRTRTDTPIITGLPFGHEDPVLTLPHGARIALAIEGRTCYLVLPHSHGHPDDEPTDHGPDCAPDCGHDH